MQVKLEHNNVAKLYQYFNTNIKSSDNVLMLDHI